GELLMIYTKNCFGGRIFPFYSDAIKASVTDEHTLCWEIPRPAGENAGLRDDAFVVALRFFSNHSCHQPLCRGRHPEHSRFSDGGKDLPRICCRWPRLPLEPRLTSQFAAQPNACI